MRNALSRPQTGKIAALDIGTTKVTCMIAEMNDKGQWHILGKGQHHARGVKSGLIVNMEEAKASIKHAVVKAEDMAGEQISTVIASLSAGRISSNIMPIEIPVGGDIVNNGHIKRMYAQARSLANAQQKDGSFRHALHTIPLEYIVDSDQGIMDAKGMMAHNLVSPMHVITANLGAVRNLTRAIEACHLNVQGIIAAPIASAEAVLSSEEKDLGCAIIDIGGGTTSLAVYNNGHCVYVEVLPFGGRTITSDIARILPTTLPFAEQLKTKFGSADCYNQQAYQDTWVDAPLANDSLCAEQRRYSVNYINEIIAARVEEILEEVAKRLNNPHINKYVGKRVVITGGGSRLKGLPQIATHKLNREVRMATSVQGITSNFEFDPSYCVCIGLINHAIRDTAMSNNSHLNKFDNTKFPLSISIPNFSRVRRFIGI